MDTNREMAAEWERGTIIIWMACVRPHMADLLSDEEIDDQLPEAWEREDDEIIRVYEFDDYLRGVNFAQMVGEIAEAQFHHPEIIIRYAGVEIRLTSHEAGGITDDDIEMAELIESEHN
ncbi:4a-hydroxytetrahydrobiopterin dehydratase [Natrinema hispanicum]|uniref:4a-hydroxytetrahydrobiopterin dehydratase n=2 Tax=Natrinema hispanicum TaxID=392421 RepID=A0A1G6HWN0_9EURY|nr:4a-hydroxytetrahydrobiopterin dehydratase [Natrinema hispanicum]SES91631.1 4a-hydroxytetrahydrobiopterin dehydratase [Natrinema hispanicum]